MTQLIVAFRNFAKASNMKQEHVPLEIAPSDFRFHHVTATCRLFV